MKIYLKEEKLPLIKESQDEVTFYGFFTQVKNFMKELLKGNVTAEPSQELKSHGLGAKELISRLKKKGLLKSEENIDEVPNEDDESKLRARHTITYSVPRRDFEKKFHRLYSEIFESEWKSKPLSEEKELQMCPNIIGVVAGTGAIGQGTCERFADAVNQNKDKHFGVFKNEKEEIQKILDNDTDGSYHERGGYKLQEGHHNEDYMLYNYCGCNKLYDVLKTNTLKSRDWDRDECICFTRDKRFIVDTSSKMARITVDPKKLPISRKLKLRTFQANLSDHWLSNGQHIPVKEYEERLYSTDRKKFTLENIQDFVIRIDIDVSNRTCNEIGIGLSYLKDLVRLLEKSPLYNITFFHTERKEFRTTSSKYILNVKEYKEYLNHYEHGNFDDKLNDDDLRTQNIQRAQEIDADDDYRDVIIFMADYYQENYSWGLKRWLEMHPIDRTDWIKRYNQEQEDLENPIYKNCIDYIKSEQVDSFRWNRIANFAKGGGKDFVEEINNIAKRMPNNPYCLAMAVRFIYIGYLRFGLTFKKFFNDSKLKDLDNLINEYCQNLEMDDSMIYDKIFYTINNDEITYNCVQYYKYVVPPEDEDTWDDAIEWTKGHYNNSDVRKCITLVSNLIEQKYLTSYHFALAAIFVYFLNYFFKPIDIFKKPEKHSKILEFLPIYAEYPESYSTQELYIEIYKKTKQDYEEANN